MQQRFGSSNETGARSPNLGDLLTARPSGLAEPEAWAVLCQSVQALQDLFLSDGATSNPCLPLVTPNSLVLSAKGRVKLYQNHTYGFVPPPHLAGYLAPEYRSNKRFSDTEVEKMWIYALGETMKRATLTSHAATIRLSIELCRLLTFMTRLPASSRASLMNLLDVISEYCKNRRQNRPFSHIVMDLHQEAMAAVEMVLDTPWGPPAMPELRPRSYRSGESHGTEGPLAGTIPRRWLRMKSKLTREASTSMEDVTYFPNLPGNVRRPKSLCVPDSSGYFAGSENVYAEVLGATEPPATPSAPSTVVCACDKSCTKSAKDNARKNPVQRAASRLYSAGAGGGKVFRTGSRECVGPEFVVRAALPNRKLTVPNLKNGNRKNVLVILLNGQKLDVVCNPSATTAGQLFELIIQKEHIEENFMLGLSALIAGDFVFLPSDTRISKAIQSSSNSCGTLTLFMRVRFFLPSLRGIRSVEARHLLYLQLRRSILEHQLPCSFTQLLELDGYAMQAEFGDYREKEHGTGDYFLLEHYVPETMTCAMEDHKYLREELVNAHKARTGMDQENAEKNFISSAQKLTHYGGHFYTATWILKDNKQKDVWLYISAQGINLYERGRTRSNYGPELYEMFDWKNIQTLCYSKHYLCILPHSSKLCSSKLKKYKLKMDHKKSYFTFRLASLHHQFFLRLRTEYTSLQSLSQQFGIPLKDIKNETNSLYKLEALTKLPLDRATVNADTEFQVDFRPSSRNSDQSDVYKAGRSKSANDFTEEKWFSSGGHANSHPGDKRRGVKMGTRAIAGGVCRISRSMEAVNACNDDMEQMSLQSAFMSCSSNSIRPSSGEMLNDHSHAYIIDSSIKASSNVLPDFQESLSASLMNKFDNISFAEERIFHTVTVQRDHKGSLGIQITEGSDGNVYIQSVIDGGAAHKTANILRGDQIIAVDQRNLLGMKYEHALELLKSTGVKVEFIVSRTAATKRNSSAKVDLSNINESYLYNLRFENTMNRLRQLSSVPETGHSIIEDESPVEKHVTESCFDLSNTRKYGDKQKEVPYHKHIRYEIDNGNLEMRRNISMSCNKIYEDYEHKISNYHSLDRRLLNDLIGDNISKSSVPPIAVPRSLGLSRKWRGPVRYPVTPIKRNENDKYDNYSATGTSDEEQVFI